MEKKTPDSFPSFHIRTRVSLKSIFSDRADNSQCTALALPRWRSGSPKMGILSDDSFIIVLQITGLYKPLFRLILKCLCSDIRSSEEGW